MYMQRLVLALALFVVAATASAQPVVPRYSEVRISLDAPDALARLAEHGVVLDHARRVKTKDGWALETVLNDVEIEALARSGLVYDVTVQDLAAEYASRPAATEAERAAGRAASRVGGFGYGSMGGYYTFDEVVEKLDELAADYPSLITQRVSIGQSWEGRELWMVKISDNPGADEGEPEVLYTGLHHAREPQSMTTVLYFMYYLLEHYGSDPEVTYLVDNREMYFVPVLNPDGYVYNETTNPGGGGFWRKNRRDNGGNVFGVDLNRNYGYEWAYDDQGSSPNPSSDTYRGPGPFSEPETAAVRDFSAGREFRAALNYHSYGDLWIYPWGYRPSFYTPDSALFVDAAREMTRENGYLYGTGDQTVGYVVNGDSDDWMYGEQELKPKTFAFTPEVGPRFWPSQDEIIPLADENVEANLELAWFAGANPNVDAFTVAETHGAPNGHLDPGEPGAVTVSLQNLGQEALSGARARIVSTNSALGIENGAFGPPFSLGAFETTALGPLSFALGAEAPLGLQEGLALEIEFDGTAVRRPIGPIVVGTPVAVFSDDASSAGAWDTGSGWGLTGSNTSPPSAFTDSPSGDYPNGTTNALTLSEPLDLSGGASPQLRFMARWDIESNWDFVQIRASTDGANWTPLAGTRTRSGSGDGVQPTGEPGYDGAQGEWVEELVDLGAFAGEPEVYLQVRLRSDGSVTEDGFYVDDLAVETFANGSTVTNEAGAQPARVALYDNYPNPFARRTTVPFEVGEAGPVSLAVYDLLGQRVRVLVEGPLAAGAHRAVWDGRDAAGHHVASGVYVCVLRANGATTARKLLVVR